MPARLRDLPVWPTVFMLGFLVVWEAAVDLFKVRPIILPAPSQVALALVQRWDVLFAHLLPTLWLTVLGFALSVVGGIAVAILVTYSEVLRKGLYPIIVVTQVVPKISIAPLFIVWFDTGLVSSTLLAFLIAFFPMVINTAAGLHIHDEDLLRMARAYMGSRWQIFLKIRLPNALPYIFAGMKISITLAVIGVIVAEFVASQEGLGYLIKLSGGLFDTPLMLASIVVLSAMGLALYAIIAWAEKRVIYWQSVPGAETAAAPA